MSALFIASISAVCIYGGFLLGRWLQIILPNHHLSKEAQDTVKLGAGLVATMAALVLGLLVSSAKGTFDAMNTGIETNAARSLYLDRVLADYGPDATPARGEIRHSLAMMIAKVWPEKAAAISGLRAAESTDSLTPIREALRKFVPKTDEQRALYGEAKSVTNEMLQTRLLLLEEQQSGLPILFLVLLAGWVSLLFLTFGIFAPRNHTVAAVMLVCTLSVASSIFLIIEMDSPLDGFIKVSDAPLQSALRLLGK